MNLTPLRLAGAVAASMFLVGCAHVDKMASQMDMAVTRISKRDKPTYEGKLVNSERIGAMTALHFDDGRFVDVVEAPSGLQQGDTIRLYETERGLIAHLWQRGA